MKTREELLAINDIETQDIEVPEWKTTVRVRQLMLGTVLELDSNKGDIESNVIRTVIAGVINDDGTPMFKSGDAAALKLKNSAALLRISKAVIEMSTPGSMTKAAVEEAAKN